MARETNRTTITQINNILYAEPNYSYSTEMYGSNGLNTYEFIPPAEDYSIFVNLEAEVRGRTIRADQSSNNDTLSLEFTTDISGKTNVNILQGSKIRLGNGKEYINSFTTNYTDIFLGDLTKKGPQVETFGVSSIDISYNNYMVPEVTIEFVDIRGVTLFAQREAYETRINELGAKAKDGNVDIANTFFQCFFTFPYPKFTLIVKGFYGQPVAYELTCADFRARFDSKTGNFSCTAKFVGYYFSFLGDVMFNILCAAPYSDYIGADYWEQRHFKLRGSDNKLKDMPKMIELVKILKHVDSMHDRAAANTPEVQEMLAEERQKSDIASVRNAYESFMSLFRTKMKERDSQDGIIRFFEESNVDTGGVTKALVYFAPVEEYGDGVNLSGIQIKKDISYVFDVNEQASDYYKALSAAAGEYNNNNPVRALSVSRSDLLGEYYVNAETDIIRIVPLENNEKKAKVDWGDAGAKLSDDFKRRIETEVNNFNNSNELNPYHRYNVGYVLALPIANEIAEILSIKGKSKNEYLREIEKAKRTFLETELGWSPSVENLTRIVMAHFETLAYMIFQVGYEISNKNPRRTLQSLNVINPDDISDVPNNIKNTYVPPFPKVTRLVDHDGQVLREETWVGAYNSSDFEEVEIVHGLINAIRYVAESLHESGGTYEDNSEESLTQLTSTGAVKTIMQYPLSTLDLIAEGKLYGEHDTNELSSILGLVALRAIQILNFNSLDDIDDISYEDIGAMELVNYTKSVGSISQEMANKIKSIDADEFIEMLCGNETNSIKKPSNGRWPWEDVSEDDSIIRESYINAFKTTGDVASITALENMGMLDNIKVSLTTFPYQNLSWSKFNQEVAGSNISKKSEDYVNTISLKKNGKKNLFTVDTNIQRVGMICENQFKGDENVSGSVELCKKFTKHLLNGKDFNYEKYYDDCLRSSWSQDEKVEDYIAFIIQNAEKIYPTECSGMFPSSISLAKSISEAEKSKNDTRKIFGTGYNMDNFHKENPGDDWKTANWHYESESGEVVRRVKPDGSEDANAYDYYFKRLNNKNITITEFFGVDNACWVMDGKTTLFSQAIYYRQKTDYAKAFLFLCSLGGFYDYNDIVDMYIEEEDESIFVIPLCAVMFYGGLVYFLRHKNEFWGVNPVGTYRQTIEGITKLPEQVKIRFMNIFMDWVTKGFDGSAVIKSFNEIKSGLELTVVQNPSNEMAFKDLEDFFSRVGDINDSSAYWAKEANYGSVLGVFANTFTSSFFENYICADRDVYGSFEAGTKGIRLGNRDGAICVMHAINFALAGCVFIKNSVYFHVQDDTVDIDKSDLKEFFNGFKSGLKDSAYNEDFRIVNRADLPDNTTDDIKIGIYRYLKLLYDKWLAGMPKYEFEEKWTFHKFFEGNDRYFYFIDAYYNQAGYLPLNIGHFAETMVGCFSTDSQYSLLSFLSNIYAHNKFQFLCIQNFIDLSDPDNMKSMFDLVPYTRVREVKRIPNFVVSYAYEASSYLDIEGAQYENDGFMINEHWSDRNKWPEPLKSRNAGNTDGYRIPAFGVSYGKMYQSYFTDIAVGMDNPIATEQSIKAQYQIACQAIDGENSGDRASVVTYGQDLFSVYSNNSYTCEVTMMGCAWVQPLMYFCLTNVPMFRGTYLIQKVHHLITPGNMITKFTGTRMANTCTRIAQDDAVRGKNKTQEESGSTQQTTNENRIADIDNDCPYKVFPLTGDDFGELNYGNGGNYGEPNYAIALEGTVGGAKGSNLKGTIWENRNLLDSLTAALCAESDGTEDGAMLVCATMYNRIRNERNSFGAVLDSSQYQVWKNGHADERYNNHPQQWDLCKSVIKTIFTKGTMGTLAGLSYTVPSDWDMNRNHNNDLHNLVPGQTYTLSPEDCARMILYGFKQEWDGTYRVEGKVPKNYIRDSSCKVIAVLGKRTPQVVCAEPSMDNKFKSLNTNTKLIEPVQIEANGDNHISDLATNFLNALDRTSASSIANIKLGVKPEMSSGNTIYITNAESSTQFSKVFDMIINGYGKSISEVKWIVGEGMDMSSEPVGYLVTVNEASPSFKIHVVHDNNLNSNLNIKVYGGTSTQNTGLTTNYNPYLDRNAGANTQTNYWEGRPSEALGSNYSAAGGGSVGGTIGKNFCKAIRKKYISYSQRVVFDTDGTLNEENAKKIFENDEYKLKDCYTALGDAGLSITSNVEFGDGPGDNSRWANVVQQMGSYWAQNIDYYANPKNPSNRDYFDCPLITNGQSKNCRKDCTGFVSACLRMYGVKGVAWGSYAFTIPNDNQVKTMNEGGFDIIRVSNDEELNAVMRPWDIVSVYQQTTNGLAHHAEIYVREEGGKKLSYSWGSVHNIANGGLPCKYAKKPYKTIWRCRDIT